MVCFVCVVDNRFNMTGALTPSSLCVIAEGGKSNARRHPENKAKCFMKPFSQQAIVNIKRPVVKGPRFHSCVCLMTQMTLMWSCVS